MASIMAQVRQYAAYPLPFPVLITGAPGTGKTVTARLLHDLTYPARSSFDRPFVPFNAAETPREHEISYLFGHSRGAFTGATEARKGALERANGGTLFLDELASLSSWAQQLLLTSLPTGRFRRMGDDREIEVRFRFIGATNVDPESLVAEGRLRRDLYDRFGPFIVRMPTLAERRDEILPIARGYLAWLAAHDGKGLSYHFSREAERVLLRAAWPGNLRELWFACFYAAVHAEQETLHAASLPTTCRESGATVAEGLPDDDLVRATLAATDGNRTEAAWRLGVTRRTIQRRLKRAQDGGGTA